MKRRKAAFYKEVHEVRDKYGEKQYDRDELVPDVVFLVKKHVKIDGDEDELWRAAAITVLDNLDKSDAIAADGLFSLTAHVALGERLRIRRGAMTFRHLLMREIVIDTNKARQDEAWAVEKKWSLDKRTGLGTLSPEATVEDIVKPTPEPVTE